MSGWDSGMSDYDYVDHLRHEAEKFAIVGIYEAFAACCICGMTVDTRENGTPGVQLSTGEWVCSREHWEAACAAIERRAKEGTR